MALDTWLEADIKAFLDHETTQEVTPTVARLEDTEAVYANLDWRKEVRARVEQGDVDAAKQLFAQLKLKYAAIPIAHEQERAKLYETMQDCYVAIANRVLDDWHTRELLKNMEGGTENIFDPREKPVDLSRPFTAARSNVPDVPQITKSLIEQSTPFRAMRPDGTTTLPAPDQDPFSFDPRQLLHTAEDATTQAQTEQVKRVALTTLPGTKKQISSFDTERAAAVLHDAIAIALTDAHRARDLLTPLTTSETPEPVRSKATALLAALAPRTDPDAFLREAERLLTDLTVRVRAHEPGVEDTLKALRVRITEFGKTNPDQAEKAKSLLQRFTSTAASSARASKPQPIVPSSPAASPNTASPSVTPPLPVQQSIAPSIRSETELAAEREATAAYASAMRLVDDEIVKCGAFARNRDRRSAELALARGAAAVDALASSHSTVTLPLRERLERAARTFGLTLPALGAAASAVETMQNAAPVAPTRPSMPIAVPLSQTAQLSESDLAAARESAAVQERAVRFIDNELVNVGIAARSRDRVAAEAALARATLAVDALAKQFPASARPLRERLERTARVFALTAVAISGNGISGGSAPAAHTGVQSQSPSSAHESALILAARRVRLAAVAHDAVGFTAALAALELVGNALPDSQRTLLTDAIRSLRLRAHLSSVETGGRAA